MTTENNSEFYARRTNANIEAQAEHKNLAVAWLLWLFFGVLGGHRFYMGNIGMGIAMLLTGGGLGVWTLIDAFFINRRVKMVNHDITQKYLANAGVA